MASSSKLLKVLDPIIVKNCRKHNITYEEGRLMVAAVLDSIEEYLKDPRLPNVKLPMFGEFKPSIGKIHMSLKASFRNYKRKGISTREYLVARVKRIWPIKQRILKEKEGIETWPTWKDPKVKEYFQKMVEEETKLKNDFIYKSSLNGTNNLIYFKTKDDGID